MYGNPRTLFIYFLSLELVELQENFNVDFSKAFDFFLIFVSPGVFKIEHYFFSLNR